MDMPLAESKILKTEQVKAFLMVRNKNNGLRNIRRKVIRHRGASLAARLIVWDG